MATTDIRTQGDKPYYKDIEFVELKLRNHNRVTKFAKLGASGQLFRVMRDLGDTLTVWLSDVYTIGEAEYLYLREQSPEINCIVSLSGYTRYTDEAKQQAVSDEIGLFKIGEFLGALNAKQFWTYVAPKKDQPSASEAGRRGAKRGRSNG